MAIKNCWNCKGDAEFVGSPQRGFVECISEKCGCCGPYGVRVVAERKWNGLCDGVEELKVVKHKISKGKGYFKITPKQDNVLRFIAEYIEENGEAPLVRIIAEHFNFSTSTVRKHTRALEDKGFIEKDFNIERGLRVLRMA